jgi:2-oxo-4-hydroxy-4-carboxy--5-ureidoimidazoline (OHCU) decarboxylase
LQQALIKKFPDLYQSVFEVGELTDESLQNATGIITYTKNVFDVYKDILQAMAKSFGIKKFSITWSSDKNRETKQGYEVVVE